MKVFETERLLVRDWEEKDAEDLFAYAQDSEIGPPAGWEPHQSLEDSREYLAKVTPGVEMCIELKETGRVIGALGLHRDHYRPHGIESRSIGYVLSRDYWGRGIMTEAVRGLLDYAFTVLGLAIVTVQHSGENDRSRRVAEKCGFVREGILREAFRPVIGRGMLDTWVYSMTEEEWKSGRSYREAKPAWRFFQNRACPYFPCHEGADEETFSCQFCYCPLYLKSECGGGYRILDNGVKDCSECLLPHVDYDYVNKKLREQP